MRPGRRRAVVLPLLLAVAGLTTACREPAGDRDTFCAQLRRVPVITERDDLTVPDTATATRQLVTELRRLQESAPTEIRGDVSVLVGVAEDLEVALSNGEQAGVEAARQRVATATEAWKAASDNVVIFASSTCNIDLGKTG